MCTCLTVTWKDVQHAIFHECSTINIYVISFCQSSSLEQTEVPAVYEEFVSVPHMTACCCCHRCPGKALTCEVKRTVLLVEL